MIDPEEMRRLRQEMRRQHAAGSTAIDAIAENVDRVAAQLDGVDMVIAVGAMGDALADFEPADRHTFAHVVAVIALRHRRALEAAAGLPPLALSRPPAVRAAHWPAFWGALIGAALAVLLVGLLP